MTARRGCVLPADEGALERELADRVDAGQLTTHDAEQVSRMGEWLRNAGPPRGELTPAQRTWQLAALADPSWREWLGLAPLGHFPCPDSRCPVQPDLPWTT